MKIITNCDSQYNIQFINTLFQFIPSKMEANREIFPATVKSNAAQLLREAHSISVSRDELPADVFASYIQLSTAAMYLDFSIYCARGGYDGDKYSAVFSFIDIADALTSETERNYQKQIEEDKENHRKAKEDFEHVMEHYPELNKQMFLDDIKIEIEVQDMWRRARSALWTSEQLADALIAKFPNLDREKLLQEPTRL